MFQSYHDGFCKKKFLLGNQVAKMNRNLIESTYGMFCRKFPQNRKKEDLPYMLPTKFRFIGLSGFRGEDFKKSTNRLWRPCLWTDQDKMSILKIAQTWLPQAILVSDWSVSEKTSPLKLVSQMNRNLVWSIYGRSSIGIALHVLTQWN
jgi:hypothetical protein